MRQNYGMLDRLFHRIVLSRTFLGEAFYDIEKSLYLKEAEARPNGPSIFVCGLARAGTTILMRTLHETGLFASLTYADMPMVMAPNLWAKLRGGREKEEEFGERAHGDRILVSFNSPEALDEVFWRCMNPHEYVTERGLVVYSPDTDSLEEFVNYRKLVCLRYGKQRYLSKNNNNIFRLRSLAAAYPGDVFLVPFRSPVAHAQSLLNQHRRFAQASSFEADYMTWLGHHEFGVTQKDFLFDGAAYDAPPTTLDYWLQVWVNTYSHLLDVTREFGANIHLVCYEDMCRNDAAYSGAIGSICGVDEFRPVFSASQTVGETEPDPRKLEQADLLYDQLKALSAAGLNASA